MDRKKTSLEMGKRLKDLREEKGLSHERLRNAIKEKYEIDISKDSLINYETSVETHSKAYKNNGMKVEYLRCFADFYGVSADYLLGLTDTRSPNPIVNEICDYTGLTEKAVEVLNSYREFSLTAIISELIEQEEWSEEIDDISGYPILRTIESFFSVKHNTQKICQITDEDIFPRKGLIALASVRDISASDIAERIMLSDIETLLKKLKEEMIHREG